MSSTDFGTLVATAWLEAHLADADLRIFDCTMNYSAPGGKLQFDSGREAWATAHIPGSDFIDVMDELWRVMKVDGQLLISMPYAGTPGFWQDPTHIHSANEATWMYFEPGQMLYEIYRPKPWKIQRNTWHSNGNMEVILVKDGSVQNLHKKQRAHRRPHQGRRTVS